MYKFKKFPPKLRISKGLLKDDDVFIHKSITGDTFEGRITERTKVFQTVGRKVYRKRGGRGG